MKHFFSAKLTSFTVGCALLWSSHLNAQVDTSTASALQHAIDTLRISNDVKGISAAAYIPGKGIWAGTTGVSYGTTPIDTNMLLAIGSVTKTFTASEIFKIIESGQLSLDDTLGGLITLPPYVSPSITVRQLLGHKSGLGEFLTVDWQNAMMNNPYKIWGLSEALDSFATPPIAAPGSTWNYCNTNYVLLGKIIEAKKTDSFHHVLRTDLLQPYGLHNTYMEVLEQYPNTIAHNWTTPTLDPALATDASSTPHEALWSTAQADGGLMSTAADLATWGYKLYSGQVISPASLTAMLNFTSVTSSYFNGYGLGAMRFKWFGRTYWGHAGNYFGYAACMMFDPIDSVCVSVLINQDCISAVENRSLMRTLVTKLATAISSVAAQRQLDIFPNPANGLVNISLPSGAASEVSISDMAGKIVYAQRAAEHLSIATGGYPAGVYTVRINNGSGSSSRQLVIVH